MDLVDDNDPISAKELVESILYPRLTTLFQAEQASFVRLFQGYLQVDSIDEMVVIDETFFFFFFGTDTCHVDQFSPVMSD